MAIYYAGIGSRTTPIEVLEVIKKIARSLAQKGYILRSGAADGADSWAEMGCDEAEGEKEIFLPWKGFNGSKSKLYDHPQEARDMAFLHHPTLAYQSDGVISMMTRNSCQVMGADMKTPSSFVVCWCPLGPNGKPKGGTSQAIRIAEAHDIPVFNLLFTEHLQALKEFIKELDAQL